MRLWLPINRQPIRDQVEEFLLTNRDFNMDFHK